MRILYVLTCLGVGGAQMEVLDLANRMVMAGNVAHLLILTDTPVGSECPTNIPVTRLHMRKSPLSILRALWQSRKLVQQFHPDVVHSHMSHSNIFARILRSFTYIPKLICTAHNTFEGGRLLTLAYRLTDRFADLTTNVSKEATARYIKIKAAPAGKIDTVYNGIDIDHFRGDEEKQRRTREHLKVGTHFMWLAVGRLAEAKDYPNLLKAFQHVRTHRPEAILYVAGAGDQSLLLNKTRELNLQDCVHYLGVRQDVPDLMNAADAFVLSSAWEGFGLVVAEAMAAEKPVVATDAGGVAEVVGDKGYVVPIKNSEALAEAMLLVENLSVEQRRMLGQQARIRICELFSLSKIVAQWDSIYRKSSMPI